MIKKDEKINLKEIRENVSQKIPMIMERGICNFSQLSSFEHYDKIVEVVILIGAYGKSAASQFDTLEEFTNSINENCKDEDAILDKTLNFKRSVFFAEELNEKINVIWDIINNKTSSYYKDLETLKLCEKDSSWEDISVDLGVENKVEQLNTNLSSINDGW